MKAFLINKYGKKELLQLSDVADPTVGQHDVLIEVHAAGVNPLDNKIKNGEYKLVLPYKTPFILGHDVAGIIKEVGSEVTKFQVGDEVYARPRNQRIGTFAELIAVHEDDIALKPHNLSMEEAASIPLVSLTAWQVLVEKANLQRGQKVFIQAGSGGVGTIAIQLAKHLGATVATTTSSDNFALVKSLGADVVINYKTEDFEKVLHNYDVVLNSQDAKTLEKSIRILSPGGKVVSLSGPPDVDFAKKINASFIVTTVISLTGYRLKQLAKKLNLHYTFLLMRAEGTQLANITSLIETGVIKPVVDKVFPFEQTNAAMEYVGTGKSKGKVVVKVK